MKKNNVGSPFDSWLRETGIYEEVTATAIKRVLARQVESAMKEKQVSKAALDRLLDPDCDAVTLSTLRKAAVAVGRELRLELVQKLVGPRPILEEEIAKYGPSVALYSQVLPGLTGLRVLLKTARVVLRGQGAY